MRPWFINVTAAFSQFWNAFWGGNRDQSFSSRSYEARLTGRPWGRVAVPVIDLLFGPGHCSGAYHSDTERTYN